MAEYLAGEYLAPSDMFDKCLKAVDAMFAAANSIPEGPPVGTIARRPDGAWIAVRRAGYWGYRHLFGLSDDVAQLSSDDGPDSWPQIRPDEWPDPDEYHEGDKPRLERLMREPSVFDADPTRKVVNEVLDALGRLDGTVKSAVKLLTGFSDERLEELGGFADPTAQQEPVCSSVSDEYVSAHKPRTPRVVDRLGVDEQGSPWQSTRGVTYEHGVFDGVEQWHINGRPLGAGYKPSIYGPYTQILEPRVLDEEA